MKKIPTRLEDLKPGKIRNGEVHISAFLVPDLYFRIVKYANLEIGKWESELIRRALRQWAETQEKASTQQSQAGSRDEGFESGGQGVKVLAEVPLTPRGSSQRSEQRRRAQK